MARRMHPPSSIRQNSAPGGVLKDAGRIDDATTTTGGRTTSATRSCLGNSGAAELHTDGLGNDLLPYLWADPSISS
jgi:hypothetical protein